MSFRLLVGASALFMALACVHDQTPSEEQAMDSYPYRSIASEQRGGYALSDEDCGEGNLRFPKLKIGSRKGTCVGLVAGQKDGLIFPRTIVQLPRSKYFVVVDMGSWSPNLGRVLLLDPTADSGKRLKVLISKLDAPHGLQVGIDGKIYVGTVDKIFRFDPLAGEPERTVEIIVRNLPGRNVRTPGGAVLEHLAHPLKNFIFDRTGRLFVNIGSPTDNCLSNNQGTPETAPCWASEVSTPLASIYMYTPPSSGVFPALSKSDPNPKFEVYAKGLRNSMALAVHSRFPSEGYAFLQGENARDLPDPMNPNEELNAVEKGQHYGWPYCYNLNTTSVEYADFLKLGSKYQGFCNSNNTAIYKKPLSLMPPHVAPLSMLYYEGTKFPELQGKLLVSWHGYRPTGSRVVYYDVDEKGFPKISPPPVYYRVSCASPVQQPFRTETQAQVAAAPFTELLGDWHKVNGVRPQGAPVGLAVAEDGAIWVVEDKNQTILRIDVDPSGKQQPQLPCDSRSTEQVEELMKFIGKDPANRTRLTKIRAELVEKHCVGCHADFNLKKGMSDVEKDATVARFMLGEDGWVYPGDPASSRIHERVWGIGAEKQMPADGADLIAKKPAYKALLKDLDQFILTMVPGKRMKVISKLPLVSFQSLRGVTCGQVPIETVVVVVDRAPSEKPGDYRIYRPADRFLNGNCTDADGYYIAAKNAKPI